MFLLLLDVVPLFLPLENSLLSRLATCHAPWEMLDMVELSIRIDFAPGQRLGPGKVRLLEQIAAHGSIAAGGRALGMSYKRAWDLVDEMNTIFGAPVVAPRSGGQKGGGATLTDLGARLVEKYREVEKLSVQSTKSLMDAIEKEVVIKPR
jgi:molybdate transport system regulatory protein